MKKFYYSVIAVTSIMLVLYLPHSAVAKNESKNILFIAADDLGIDGLQLYTNKLDLTDEEKAQVPPTPTIDSLAADGVTFSNAWANPACSPTRGTLITGRYGFRTGITWVVGRFTTPGGEGELDVNDPDLLPKVLKEKGYATALIGKWHMTSGPNAPSDPNTAGFDYWAGYNAGGTPYYNWPQIINGSPVPFPPGQPRFATTENVDQAIHFIKNEVPEGKPWFISLNFAAPHFRYTTPPIDLVDPDVVAQVETAVGAVEPGWTYQENFVVPGPGPPNPLNTRPIRRAVFNALVSAMDTEIGRLLEHVNKDKTCIIFIGDNGTQGSIVPFFDVVVSPFDPDKAKTTLYEYGMGIPMVVYDPSIKKPGRFTDALVNTVDIYAMILKIAGCPSPNRFDGKQFNAILKAPKNNVSVRNYIFAEQTWQELDGIMPPNPGPVPTPEGYAIRNDRYKLIKLYVDNDGQVEVKFEFYDLLEDQFEENDLLLGDLTKKEKSNYKWLTKKLEKLLSSKK